MTSLIHHWSNVFAQGHHTWTVVLSRGQNVFTQACIHKCVWHWYKVPTHFVFIIVSVNDNNFLTPVTLSNLPKTHTLPVPLVLPSSESEPFSHPLKDICSSTSSYTRYAHWPQLCGRIKNYYKGRKQALYRVSEANNLWDGHMWTT